MTENPEQPIKPEHAASAARNIIARLVAQWREGGLPLEALSEGLIEEGLEQIISERGPAAAVSVLQHVITETQKRII